MVFLGNFYICIFSMKPWILGHFCDHTFLVIAHISINFDFPLSRNVVVDCGRLQMALANEVVEHEARVEEKVVTLLHTVSEGEVPNIQKLKRNLAKLILDMDSARTRYWSWSIWISSIISF